MPRFITKVLLLDKTIDNNDFLHRNAKIWENSYFLLTAFSSPIWYDACSDWTNIPLEAVTHANSCYSWWSKYNRKNLSCVVTSFHLNVFYSSASIWRSFPLLYLNTYLLFYYYYYYWLYDWFNYSTALSRNFGRISTCRHFKWVTLVIASLYYGRLYTVSRNYTA